ncbi:MAG: glycosyltransferase, partial [Syntrophales bacterium]
MLNNKTVAVVVPAYNEEKQIIHVITTMPNFVDRIIVVNDCSTDKTADLVSDYMTNQNSAVETVSKRNRPAYTKYNQAEVILHEMAEKEIGYYVPSEVVN